MISKKNPKNPKNINPKNKNRNENTNQINTPPPEKMKQNKFKKTYKLKKILLELVFSVILS